MPDRGRPDEPPVVDPLHTDLGQPASGWLDWGSEHSHQEGRQGDHPFTASPHGATLMAARPLRHPDIAGITVADILYALADPIRLAIVSELLEAGSGMNCVETMSSAKIVLPKSTCSQHFQILRDAGLIHCERNGVELTSRIRSRELSIAFRACSSRS